MLRYLSQPKLVTLRSVCCLQNVPSETVCLDAIVIEKTGERQKKKESEHEANEKNRKKEQTNDTASTQ